MPPIADWVLGNFSWNVVSWIFLSLIGTAPFFGVAKFAFDALQSRRQQIAFWCTVPFILLFTISLINSVASPRPSLVPNQQFVAFGGTGDNGVIAHNPVFLIETIVNSGDQPSVALSYQLTADLHGKKYEATRQAIPNLVRLKVKDAGSVTYAAKDALYNKTSTAIPAGGATTGLLFFQFPNLTDGVIETEKPSLTLTFNDAKGTTYHQNVLLGSEPNQIPVSLEWIR